jgi:hypothetical protein
MTSTNAASAGVDQRSGRTRVTPVFEWFQAHGGSGWVAELLQAWLGCKFVERKTGEA